RYRSKMFMRCVSDTTFIQTSVSQIGGIVFFCKFSKARCPRYDQCQPFPINLITAEIAEPTEGWSHIFSLGSGAMFIPPGKSTGIFITDDWPTDMDMSGDREFINIFNTRLFRLIY
ncbi:hypothetical protein JW998_17520, partial [candidate division KSB1 bacterium]|nr:hypothetical protein [candidate division KSB1 bacterium]